MPAISPLQLIQLTSNQNQIKNFCILAHVDHGKTTLSDSLLASNGIISSKMSGKIRYLDSRQDEQERGITMKSSSISLFYRLVRNILNSQDGSTSTTTQEYLISLIDSPGHVDFSSEVSTASKLCDGALVLVDVVEGVCTQTIHVLSQAWKDKLTPILVFNKMDRLILELKLEPNEAYLHILKILEQVNAVMASLFSAQVLEEDALRYEESKLQSRKNAPFPSSNVSSSTDKDNNKNNNKDAYREAGTDTHEWVLKEQDDSHVYFSPQKGNVIFASAIDGWAFRTSTFSKIYASKLGIKESLLTKVLWGNYFLESKTRKIVQKGSKNMFCQFILDNIWAVYKSVLDHDKEKMEKIVSSLGLKVLPRDLKSKDPKWIISIIMSQWLPLSMSVLLSVVEIIPSPKESQRVKFQLPLGLGLQESVLQSLQGNYISWNTSKRIECDSKSNTTLAFVSKMFSVDKECLTNSQDATPEDLLIGFARIYSGTLKVGQEIHVLGPKYNPSFPSEHCSTIKIKRLFLLMGRDLQDTEQVYAGNVFGISGLHGSILKYGTLSSTKEIQPNFISMDDSLSQPIVRVALEAVDPSQTSQLLQGLVYLNQADPCVQVILQESGENVIVCAGELHLERCINDLNTKFAKIPIHVSAPIVPFRETITCNLGLKMGSLTLFDKSSENTSDNKERPTDKPYERIGEDGMMELSTPALTLKLQCVSMSLKVLKFLLKHQDSQQDSNTMDKSTFKQQLSSIWEQEKNIISLDKLWAFGPKDKGPNMLFYNLNQPRSLWGTKGEEFTPLEKSILTGFQLATQAGPLCNEPMAGVVYILHDLVVKEGVSLDPIQTASLSGQVISTVKGGCLKGFMNWSSRLMLAYYTCEIQAPSEVLGKVYGVLSKRRGKILSEEMRQGTNIFVIQSTLPVIESFGFADELRKKTSGAASTLLIFSGYQMLDLDPFWIPNTEEELEDLGEKSDKENIAKKYMDQVRLRKGLLIDKKLIDNAEKQKTLKNK